MYLHIPAWHVTHDPYDCVHTEGGYLEEEDEHDPMAVETAEEVEEGALLHETSFAHPRAPLLHFLSRHLAHHVVPRLLERQLDNRGMEAQ